MSDVEARPSPEPTPSGGGLGPLPVIGLVSLILAVGAMFVLGSFEDEVTAPAPAAAARTAAPAESAPPVGLTLFVEREGKASPLDPGTDVQVGDRILFEVQSERPARVRLWVEEAGAVIQDLGTVEAEPTPVMVGGEGGLLAWGFGSARTVTIRASAAAAGCPAASCKSQVVVAR